MKTVERITIIGKSGYLEMHRPYRDKVMITSKGIQYQLVNHFQLDPDQKWTYRTNNPSFQQLFRDAVEMLPGVLEYDESDYVLLDGEPIKLTVTYNKEESVSKEILFPDGVIIDFFRIIRKMVPPLELTPKVLWLPEDIDKNASEARISI